MKKMVLIALILVVVFAFSGLAHALVSHGESHLTQENIELSEHHCLCSHFVAFESCNYFNFDFGTPQKMQFSFDIKLDSFDSFKNLYRPPMG